jgi:ADP-ribose diphosphatase
MLDDDTVLMIYEYSSGTHRYELALTKGKIDAGESPLEAANRELIEEIGYGAKNFVVAIFFIFDNIGFLRISTL